MNNNDEVVSCSGCSEFMVNGEGTQAYGKIFCDKCYDESQPSAVSLATLFH